ncbi:hypothetical protein [Georgenia thermotolerans]|uniref:Uncharacterized protein n=1 Tax=Georgenia thermotolerans TaxID=527326 RepID=A0A7J5UTW8_9MICO|nr:hypothetical protein [Georgenia thermotolerans]KAE8765729.1 hypothetical protein GB883_02120 [Georgenia thermotolerans]
MPRAETSLSGALGTLRWRRHVTKGATAPLTAHTTDVRETADGARRAQGLLWVVLTVAWVCLVVAQTWVMQDLSRAAQACLPLTAEPATGGAAIRAAVIVPVTIGLAGAAGAMVAHGDPVWFHARATSWLLIAVGVVAAVVALGVVLTGVLWGVRTDLLVVDEVVYIPGSPGSGEKAAMAFLAAAALVPSVAALLAVTNIRRHRTSRWTVGCVRGAAAALAGYIVTAFPIALAAASRCGAL